MSQFFYLAGGDIGAGRVRLVDGIQGFTTYADGNVATGGLVVDDPTGSLALQPWMTFSHVETACSQPRTFTGSIYNLTQDRGPYINGAGRIWTFEIEDLNGLLRRRDLRNNASKRPRESGSARMSWLLGSVAMSGLVYDNGMVQSNAALYDEADYRQRYAADVLADITVTSPGGDGLVFFVYWDPVALQPSLYYGSPLAPLNLSTLRISNVLSDIDGVTTFGPKKDESLSGKGEAIYDGVSFVYKGVPIYRQRASTFAEFGVHRDAVVETDRIGHLDTAEAHAELFLDNHDGRVDTITCTVSLPASKVNLIDAGMLVDCKFSHLDGYESFTPMRVTSRTVVLADQTNEFYDLQLELSIRALNTGGGGSGAGGAPDPGDFPTPPPAPTPQAHWWMGSFAMVGAGVNLAGGGNSGSNSATIVRDTNYNWSVTPHTFANINPSSNHIHIIDPGSFPIIFDQPFLSSDDGTEFTGTFLAGATSNPIRMAGTIDHLGNGTIPSCTVDFWVDPDDWVAPEAPEQPLPSPGQWVYDDVPTPAPDGATATFYTSYPFADGSLRVKVDGTDQTAAIISYDGGTADSGTGIIGGDSGGRGQRAVTLLTPAATVASPFGLTQINAARVAAGTNGIVRFPAATYAASPSMSVAGQKWQLAPGADITGTVSITADGCTLQGGRVANIAVPRPSHAADTYTIADVMVYGTGNPILIEGAHNGGTITNCNFSGSSLDPIKMFFDVGGDGDVTGWDVLNNIMSTNNNHSMIAANDGGGTNDIIGYRILNNYINAGARQAGDGFGIEVWGGVGGEIAFNDLRGGGFLMSTVRSQNLSVHHNLGTLSAAGAYAFFESGGSDMEDCVIEYNAVNGDGSGTFIYHDADSHDHIVRFNQVSRVNHFLEGSGGGGGYVITDNYFVDVNNWPPGVFTIPNTLARNGPSFGTTGGSFTLAFNPRASELVTATYQGR